MQKQEKTFSMEGKRVHEEEGVAQASKPENNASPAEVLGSDGRKVRGWRRAGRAGGVGRLHSERFKLGWHAQ